MRRLLILLSLCCLVGCGRPSEGPAESAAPDVSARGTLAFPQQQERLFHEIDLDKNSLTLVLMGGFDHAGVCAYPNDRDAVPRNDDMELIPGLRYYDDGLEEAGEEHREYLKSLEHEALVPLDWQRKQMNLPLPKRQEVPGIQ